MLDALAGAGGGILSSGAQFGLNYAAGLLDAKIQRSLRRTVYQDQMHSMRKAGLNPILAAGSTPGMGSSGYVDAPDLAKNVSTARDTSKLGSEKRLLQSQETQAAAGARKAEAEARTAELIRDDQEAKLRGEADLAATRARNESPGPTDNREEPGVVWRRTDREGTRAQAGAERDMAEKFRIHAEQQAIEDRRERDRAAGRASDASAESSRASAGLSSAKQKGEESLNVGRDLEARWLQEYETLVRAGKTADEIYGILGPVSDFILRRRGLNQVDARDRRTDARGQRDTVTREREQDRRDRVQERREYQDDF